MSCTVTTPVHHRLATSQIRPSQVRSRALTSSASQVERCLNAESATIASPNPFDPGDVVDCPDLATEAGGSGFDTYYPSYGDVERSQGHPLLLHWLWA